MVPSQTRCNIIGLWKWDKETMTYPNSWLQAVISMSYCKLTVHFSNLKITLLICYTSINYMMWTSSCTLKYYCLTGFCFLSMAIMENLWTFVCFCSTDTNTFNSRVDSRNFWKRANSSLPCILKRGPIEIFVGHSYWQNFLKIFVCYRHLISSLEMSKCLPVDSLDLSRHVFIW